MAITGNQPPQIGGSTTKTVVVGETIPFSQMTTATWADPDGDAITQIGLYDATPGKGYITVNGQPIPSTGQVVDASLWLSGAIQYVAGSEPGTNQISMTVFDSNGAESAQHVIDVTVKANQPPVINGLTANSLQAGQMIPMSSLAPVTWGDPDGDAITRIGLFDAIPGKGYITVNGQPIPSTGQVVDASLWLSDAIQYVAGPDPGTNQISLTVFDSRGAESAQHVFDVTVTPAVGGTTLPTVSIEAIPDYSNRPEGNNGETFYTFKVILSEASTSEVTVDWAIGMMVGSSTADDLAGVTSGTIRFPVGSTSVNLNVPIRGDTTYEPDERIEIVLVSANGASIKVGGSAAILTIENDDAVPPTISIAPLSADKLEGDEGSTPFTFEVTRTGVATGPITVVYDVMGQEPNSPDETDIGAAGFPRRDSVTLEPDQDRATITVEALGDLTVEPDEEFIVLIHNVTGGAIIGQGGAVGTIRNDDHSGPPPTIPSLSVNDPSPVPEGGGAIVFTVALSAPSTQRVDVTYSTLFGTANAGGAQTDYKGLEEQILSFAPGETSKQVEIGLLDDAISEPNESFALLLESPVNATIADDRGLATIVDDDEVVSPPPPPADTIVGIRSLGGGALPEGNSGSTIFSFEVDRTSPPTGSLTLGWKVESSGAQAANGADFLGGVLPSGSVTIENGNSRAIIDEIRIVGDRIFEPDESFRVVLTSLPSGFAIDPSHSSAIGIIENDDRAPPLVIGNVSGSQFSQAARLSEEAYWPTYPDQTSVIDFPADGIAPGWTPLRDADLDLTDGTLENGVFKADVPTEELTTVAQVYAGRLEGKVTLALAIRGTDENGELIGQLGDYGNYMQAMQPLLASVRNVAQNGLPGVGPIEQVLVTGHSLGGSLAERFVAEYIAADSALAATTTGVTFGSPGGLGDVGNVRFLNVIHNDDIAGNVIFGRADGAILEVERGEGFVAGPTEHAMSLYRDTAMTLERPDVKHVLLDILANDEQQSSVGWIDQLMRLSARYSIGIGADDGLSDNVADTLEVDGNGRDIIFGLGGGDTIKGGGGDDYIVGGIGVDTLSGGSGADKFIGNLADHNGDRIKDFNFQEGDRILLDGQVVTAQQVNIRLGSAIIEFDLDLDGTPESTLTLEGTFDPRGFELTFDGSGNTEIKYVEAPPNTAPVADNDSASTAYQTAVVIDVLDGDTDAEGNLDRASVVIASPGTKGNAVFDATTQKVTYTPAANQTGADSFTYTVKDTEGLSSDAATVSVQIGLKNISGNNLPNRLNGTDAAERIDGRGGVDVIRAGGGDDVLIGGQGFDILDGGAGVDTAVFKGVIKDFLGVTKGSRLVIDRNLRDGYEGNDSITNVELLQFDDALFDLRTGQTTNGPATASLGSGPRPDALLTKADIIDG